MSSDERNMERERLERDAVRAGFVQVLPGQWVRASAIEAITTHPDRHGTTGCEVWLVGNDDAQPTNLTVAQLLRQLVVLAGGRA